MMKKQNAKKIIFTVLLIAAVCAVLYGVGYAVGSFFGGI